jgi:CubicO group peptidase (beta-lactamase class C family)
MRVLTTLLAVFLTIPVFAQLRQPNAAEIDAVFAEVDRTNTPGCSLAITHGGKVIYSRGYGMASLEHGVANSPETVFYIASVSKQFTAATIVLLAEEGKVALDDSVRKYVPELPAYADAITLRHLIHHTSGLRDYLSLSGLTGRSDADTFPESEALKLIARQKALNFAPGEKYAYSNSGYFLLGLIAKRVTGKSLREAADERIFAPLGMTSTRFRDDRAVAIKHRADGHFQKEDGTWGVLRTSFDLVGSGGLTTSVVDLAKWEANFYENRLGKRGPAFLEEMLTPGRLANGNAMTYAFGLERVKLFGRDAVEHDGGSFGYAADFLRFPAERLGVICLCNGTVDALGFARKVAELHLPAAETKTADAPQPAAPQSAANVPAAELQKLTGLYWNEDADFYRRVELADGALVYRRSATNQTRLIPLSPTTVAMDLPAPRPELTFAGDTMTFRAGDDVTVFRRVTPFTPKVDELRQIAGRYRSEELGRDVELTLDDKGALTLMLGEEAIALAPAAVDVLTGGGMVLRLERTRGKVSGFTLSTPRVRNVRFVRS